MAWPSCATMSLLSLAGGEPHVLVLITAKLIWVGSPVVGIATWWHLRRAGGRWIHCALRAAVAFVCWMFAVMSVSLNAGYFLGI